MGRAYVALNNFWIHKANVIARNFDLSLDDMTNKRKDRTKLRDILHLINWNRLNYADIGRNCGIKFKKQLCKYFVTKKEKKKQHQLSVY